MRMLGTQNRIFPYRTHFNVASDTSVMLIYFLLDMQFYSLVTWVRAIGSLHHLFISHYSHTYWQLMQIFYIYPGVSTHCLVKNGLLHTKLLLAQVVLLID
jgi:hypothetical protein